MKKCIIWGTVHAFVNSVRLIQLYEAQGLIEVVGVTSDDSFYKSVFTYRYIPKNQISDFEFDYLICAEDQANMGMIQSEVLKMGIDPNSLIPISVMNILGFDFDKYIKIRNNIPTIFSPHCWGGLTYHKLALPFNSPFINMFELHDDFLKFLKDPKYYMECPVEFVDMRFERNLKRNFPVAKCEDITLFFNHYDTFEEAKECWDRRKQRINWDHLFIEFYDEDEEKVDEFLRLPYKNKLCFVPFPMEHKNVISLANRKDENVPFWKKVTDTTKGICYDVFELLLNNEIVLLNE